jgi:hypothetical protein
MYDTIWCDHEVILVIPTANPAAVASPIKLDKLTSKKVTTTHTAITEPVKAVTVRLQEHASLGIVSGEYPAPPPSFMHILTIILFCGMVT